MLVENYLGVNCVHLEGGKAWQPPNEGFFFIFLSEGNGEYFDERLNRQLRSGDILFLRQNGKPNRFVAKDSGMAFRWFSLREEQLYPLFDISELGLLQDVLESFESVKPFQASTAEACECRQLIAEIPSDPTLEQRGQVLAVAARILSKEFETARTRRPGFLRADEHMEKVFQTLSEAEFLKLPVSQLAARFGCSRRHLNRLFHQFFGYSIAEFRMELRLSRVACLLRNPNLKIISVAEQCGFNHLGNFNARFKRRFGLSPGQWRKRLPAGSGETDSRGPSAQQGDRILQRWATRQRELAADAPEFIAPPVSNGSQYAEPAAPLQAHANC